MSIAAILVIIFAICTFAQSTEFTYQGSLKDGANPANANYDFEFRLFAVDTGGSAIGTLQRLNVAVSNGVFSVKLDFGAQFPGAARYLEIGVRTAGGGSFQTLLPRNQISNAPYSVRSLNAASADTANQLSGIPASGFIQNTTSQQPANFNISGTGVIGGNLGVGSTAPATKLDVSGPGIVRARINSDSNAGVGLTLNNQPGWSVATVTGGQFQIFNDMIGQNAVWITPATNNVGIGTTAPSAKLDVVGDIKASGTITGPRTTMSTATEFVGSSGTPILIPGLTQTIVVSGNAKLLVQFGVHAHTNVCIACDFSKAQIDIVLNGTASNSVYHHVPNNVADAYISGSWLLAVGPGTHTVEIRAKSFGPPIGFGLGVTGSYSHLIVQVIPE